MGIQGGSCPRLIVFETNWCQCWCNAILCTRETSGRADFGPFRW